MTEQYRAATILCSAYDPNVAKLVCDVLGMRGYNIITASHADNAIPQVHKSDLVISDVKNGGRELLGYVNEHMPGVEVVLMNGGLHDLSPIADKANILPKPFTIDQLITLVNKLIPEHLKPIKAQ